jgi:hypothetical protein
MSLGRFVLDSRLHSVGLIWGLSHVFLALEKIHLPHLWVEKETGTNYLSFSTSLR